MFPFYHKEGRYSMPKKHFTVVRNQGYSGGGFSLRERHNERKNECYHNGDIIPERSHLNVHFHRHFSEDGAPETYEQTFNRLLESGAIVKRGLKPDAKVFDELIFDVNTEFFENNDGYDFAKKFYEEAYRLAVKEIGGEQYVLSAILHADERNRALSEELGRDVYHYHLHVCYVPVVQKEILWSKRCKDPALVGTVKEVIPQISHSKKWPLRVPVERDGKTIMLNSYSLLQDRYFEHMRAAGFDGFERGERGSTTEHLSDLDYKIQQDKQRSAKLDKEISQKRNQVTALEKNVKTIEGKALTVKQIEKIPVKISRPIIGGSDNDTATLSKKDWDNLKKTAVTQAQKDEDYRAAISENAALKKEKSAWRSEKQGFEKRVKELERKKMDEAFERAGDKAALHNLKNAVARIPKDVWDRYTKPQQAKSLGQGR